jgi:pimeloyl-ACP methyl ester carboxylesterase
MQPDTNFPALATSKLNIEENENGREIQLHYGQYEMAHCAERGGIRGVAGGHFGAVEAGSLRKPGQLKMQNQARPLAMLVIFGLLAVLPISWAAEPRPLGKMVGLGGHRLHINCSGRGSPTVVIVPSGHNMQLEAPQAVTQAIRDVVEECKKEKNLKR